MVQPNCQQQLIHQRRSMPLQLVLVVPFMLQICTTVGITGWLSFRSGQQTIQEIVTRLQQEVSERIIKYTQNYLAVPIVINQLSASELRTRQLNPQNLDQLSHHFVDLHHVFRQGINHISFGNQDGTYVAVRRSRGQYPFEVLLVPSNALGQLHTYYANDRGDLIKKRRISLDYDPRQRPWYHQAVQAGKPSWTGIYNYFDATTLGISHVYPIYASGKLQGVLATDFDLADISKFLQSLKIGKTGQAFIIERNGQLVASSYKENLFVITPTSTERITASQSQSVLVSQVSTYLQSQFDGFKRINRPYQLSVNTSSGRQFVQIMPLVQENGISWLLVVIIPRADFMAEIYRNAQVTAVFCAITLVLSSLVGLLICRWISRSMLRFSQAAQAIADGKLSPTDTYTITPPIAEIVTLAQVFDQMQQQLQASFATLEQTNRTLETQVAQRTLELQRANQALYQLATVDELTQLANRRRFEEYLAQAWQQAQQAGHHLALILCDVDCFKAYNDNYGHRAGDICLQQVAWSMRQAVQQPSNLIARYGGEEFAIVLPAINLAGAEHIAEEIRQSVCWLRISHEYSPVSAYVTVSLGVCSLVPNPDITMDVLIDTADKALYEAKANGRNRFMARSL
ncbi:MAG: diguanylate cyclase [Cyanobacteria bacterium]|nr:diguanylate cyclase [Cyanobacteriota bacterium]MDW8202536.1 diguanylate cyclase [Cyanobacteriota bacterium SKYGB_h_bin112]